MEENAIIEKTRDFVKKRLKGEGSGHDWWHTYRVWLNALKIGKEEKANLFIVQLTALLHDIADWKFHEGNEEVGPSLARDWLEKLNVEENMISHICNIIKEMSFKGAGVVSKMTTKEGEIVQDADRLDAIGAIGIARTFAYGGHTGREIYDPETKPEKHENFEQYKKNSSPTINHFYEKLLLLKDLMNTQSALKIAEKRHKHMKIFLEEFFKEWNGEE